MTTITSATRRIATVVFAAIMLVAFVTAMLIAFHTTAANGHQALHHASEDAHLAFEHVWDCCHIAACLFHLIGPPLRGRTDPLLSLDRFACLRQAQDRSSSET